MPSLGDGLGAGAAWTNAAAVLRRTRNFIIARREADRFWKEFVSSELFYRNVCIVLKLSTLV